MMQGVVPGGTAAPRAAAGSRGRVAGKTGTTPGLHERVVRRFTRQVIDGRVGRVPGHAVHSLGESVFGGTLAAPIWHDYMLRVMAGMPARSFPGPPRPHVRPVPDVFGLKSERGTELARCRRDFTPLVEVVDSAEAEGDRHRPRPEAAPRRNWALW